MKCEKKYARYPVLVMSFDVIPGHPPYLVRNLLVLSSRSYSRGILPPYLRNSTSLCVSDRDKYEVELPASKYFSASLTSSYTQEPNRCLYEEMRSIYSSSISNSVRSILNTLRNCDWRVGHRKIGSILNLALRSSRLFLLGMFAVSRSKAKYSFSFS